MLPHLKEMKEKEMAWRETRETLGLSQAFELGKRSTEEYVLPFLLIHFVMLTDVPWTDERGSAGWKRKSLGSHSAWTSPLAGRRHNSSHPRNRALRAIDVSRPVLYL